MSIEDFASGRRRSRTAGEAGREAGAAEARRAWRPSPSRSRRRDQARGARARGGRAAAARAGGEGAQARAARRAHQEDRGRKPKEEPKKAEAPAKPKPKPKPEKAEEEARAARHRQGRGPSQQDRRRAGRAAEGAARGRDAESKATSISPRAATTASRRTRSTGCGARSRNAGIRRSARRRRRTRRADPDSSSTRAATCSARRRSPTARRIRCSTWRPTRRSGPSCAASPMTACRPRSTRLWQKHHPEFRSPPDVQRLAAGVGTATEADLRMILGVKTVLTFVVAAAAILAGPLAPAPVAAALQVDITGGQVEPMPIALPAFLGDSPETAQLGADIAAVSPTISKARACSGRCRRNRSSSRSATSRSEPRFGDWRHDPGAGAGHRAGAPAVGRKAEGGVPPVGCVRPAADPRPAVRHDAEKLAADRPHDLGRDLQDDDGRGRLFRYARRFRRRVGPKDKRVKRLAIMDQDGENVRMLSDGKRPGGDAALLARVRRTSPTCRSPATRRASISTTSRRGSAKSSATSPI